MVITPVCPHTLTNRAIVVSDSSEIELLIADQRDPLYLTVDVQRTGSEFEDPLQDLHRPTK